MKPDDDYNLTKRGREIMRKFGSRMRKRLQEVLNQDAKTNSRRINAQTTSIVRTVQSAEEFFSGMFKDSEEKPTIQINSKDDDYLLKFPDLCSRFIQVLLNLSFLFTFGNIKYLLHEIDDGEEFFVLS